MSFDMSLLTCLLIFYLSQSDTVVHLYYGEQILFKSRANIHYLLDLGLWLTADVTNQSFSSNPSLADYTATTNQSAMASLPYLVVCLFKQLTETFRMSRNLLGNYQ